MSARSTPEVPTASTGRPTTELENLRAFAELYGYVRFFHPTDAAAEAPWQEIAAHGLAEVRDARTTGELIERLERVFLPLAPSLQLWTGDDPAPAWPEPVDPRATPVYWQYEGFPGAPLALYLPPYRRVRVNAQERGRPRFFGAPPIVPMEEVLAGGVRMRLPLMLDQESLEHAREAGRLFVDPWLAEMATDDEGWTELDVRQGAVVEVWNVLRHFYPYQDVLGRPWGELLAAALSDAEDDESREDTRRTLAKLVHAIHDGHGEVGHRRGRARGHLPFRLEVVEDLPVVTAVADEGGFAIGDVVESIDGHPALERIGALESLVSGSSHWRRFKAATWEAPRGPRGERVTVSIRRQDEHVDVETEYAVLEVVEPERPPAIHRYPDGVFYVDLTRALWPEIAARMPEIAAAPGVVFDLRGYPEDNHAIIDHLLDEPEDALWMHVPRIVSPGGQPVGWLDLGWHRRPAAPHIEGRVVFLISAGAISYAESILSYVDAYDLGTLVGTPSAGTNGDIVRLNTLAGFYVVFTGMRVTRHDGGEFHLRGVQPEVPVARTLAGLRAGRDEVLDAGSSVVRRDIGRLARAKRATP